MHLYDIVNQADLEAAIAAGHVKRQAHPTEPLQILNYTQTCMWDKVWTAVTRTCRGLIYHAESLQVVARPFRKFFNHGEEHAGELDMSARVLVTDKIDGSLGILYPLPSGGHAVATRGSFASEQAQHATQLWRQRYAEVEPHPGVTYLFEIIYPQNRIVLDYGGMDDLVFLAAVDVTTGRTLPPEHHWPHQRVSHFLFGTLADALRAPPRANAEGLVVHFVETDERVKIKQDDYVALHRIMTGTSPRRLWEFLCVAACKRDVLEPKSWGKLGLDPLRAQEILAAGDHWLESMLAHVPDEFFAWVKDTIAQIENHVAQMRRESLAAFEAVAHARTDRKTFAALTMQSPHANALFRLLDGKEIETYLWKQAYPAAERGWLSRSEDVA